jgi:hypothetical protein
MTRTRIFGVLLICLLVLSVVVVVIQVFPEITANHASTSPTSVSESTLTSSGGVVGTSTTFSATVSSSQRKTFYACGLFWAFYSNGSGLAYATSSDGLTWTSDGTPLGGIYGDDYCLYFDGTYAHFVEAEYETESNVYYERALPCANGSLIWGPGGQVAVQASEAQWYCVMISVDTLGRPWIIYNDYLSADDCQVTRSSTTDGTWKTDAANGFPFRFESNTENTQYADILVPLTDNKMYIGWYDGAEDGSDSSLNGVLYNGTAFGPVENILPSSYTVHGSIYVSTVNQNDSVHLVFLDNSYNIYYTMRNSTGWSNPTLIQPGNEIAKYNDSAPLLSIDETTGNLFCIWAGNPESQHIYYKKCTNGNWDTYATDWVTETSITYYRSLTCSYQKSTFIGLEYTTNTSSTIRPYQIKFAFLKQY